MPSYTWQFGVVWSYKEIFIRGAVMTLYLTLLSMLLGLALGLIFGVGRNSKKRFIHLPSAMYIEAFRGTPLLVQLVWIYYALPVLIGFNLTNFAAALVGLTLNNSSYLAEIFRGGIISIDKGQVEAARSLGMSHFQTLRRIVLPQAVRIMIPPIVNQFAAVLKLSSLASVIAVYELLHEGTNLITTTFRPLEVYTAVAVVYFILTYPMTVASRRLEAYLKV